MKNKDIMELILNDYHIEFTKLHHKLFELKSKKLD